MSWLSATMDMPIWAFLFHLGVTGLLLYRLRAHDARLQRWVDEFIDGKARPVAHQHVLPMRGTRDAA